MHARENDADIIVPRRGDKDFRASYPTEQYHSEQFANLFLDSLGNKIGLPSTDWTNGPFAFDASMATQWLEYDGEIRDAQLFVGHSWKTNEGGGGSRSDGKCDIKIATAKN